MALEKKELAAISEQIDNLAEAVETSVKNAKKDINQNVDQKIDAVKSDINSNVDQKVKATETSLQEEISSAKGISQKALDKVEALEKKATTSGMGANGSAKSFHDELGEALMSRKDDLKSFRASKKGFGAVELQAKTVGNLSSATNLTGSYFVPSERIPGVAMKLYEELHVRDILATGNTGSNTIRYVVDDGGQGGPGMVAEGATKPQSDRTLEIKDSPVRKIATYFRVPEEMIDDIVYLQSFLSTVGVKEVMVVEDNQLLYGDGTGQNLTGISTGATVFAAGASVIGASANEFDVVRSAKKQLRLGNFYPKVVFLNPVDYFGMTSRKATTNEYLFLANEGVNVGLTIDGMKVIEHNNITAGSFLVGDPAYAAIFDRMGTTIRFYDQDQDNAIKNLITIVIEKRLALVNYRPSAWVGGTFDAAITDLTS